MNASSFFAAVESELGFSFPSSFRENYDHFVDLLATPDFTSRFGHANVAASPDVIRELMRELDVLGCAPSMIPFMWQQQSEFRDYYGFDSLVKTAECPVVVFAVHTIVHDWPSFRAFLEWIKDQ